MSPEISVVIAAYNAEDTIGAELEALGRQTFQREFEVVVCDNGSTDGTAAAAQSYAGSVPGLRVIDASAVRGPGAARNAGAREAAAPLLAFCDADDVVADDWIAVMHAALDQAAFVTGRCRRLEFNARPGEDDFFTWGIYRMPFFPYLPAAGAGNMGVHREAFLEVGGFDHTLQTGEDLDLCWRLQLAGHALVEEPAASVTVSNREGLRASFAQTFAYGAGDRQLKHKYALVAEAYLRQTEMAEAEGHRHGGEQPAQETTTAPADGAPAAPGPSLAKRIWRKAVSTRRLSDLTAITRRISTQLGYRFGKIDRNAPQVVPPPTLPVVKSE